VAKDTVVKTTIEFIVRGKETYYALLDFGKTRVAVINIIKKIASEAIAELEGLQEGTGDLTVKLIIKSTRAKPIKMVKKNVAVSDVFKVEYAFVKAQKQMLDEVAKL